MKNAFDEAPCLYFTTAGDGIIADVNYAFCRKTGYRREELLGQKEDKIFPISARIFQQTHLFPLLQMQEQVEEIYIDLQTKAAGLLPVLINAERKEAGHGFVIVYVGIVVHQRKKFEDELVAAKKSAERALNENTALMQAKQELQATAESLDQQVSLVRMQNEEFRQFNRVVTHDLQEPLRKLIWFTNTLQEANNEKDTGQTVQKIKAVSEKMRAVVSGLQQYVWLTEASSKKNTINLHEHLETIQKELKEEVPAVNMNVIVEALPVFEGDAEQIHFLFQELLRNAIRFKKHDKDVAVHITATESMRNRFVASPEKYQYEACLRLQVKDNGTGFDATYREQVFELFKRLHSESGLGVGLALCKKIVENHGGDIAIQSAEGKGTTVSILLPLPIQGSLPAPVKNEIYTGKSTDNED